MCYTYYGENMKNIGHTGLEILVVIIVLGISTLTILTTTSNAFKDNSNDLYEETKYLIEHQATIYAKSLDNLSSEENIVITLDDLINAGYYLNDEDGKVVDPRNSNATLNGLKIKLTYNEGTGVSATIIEDELGT